MKLLLKICLAFCLFSMLACTNDSANSTTNQQETISSNDTEPSISEATPPSDATEQAKATEVVLIKPEKNEEEKNIWLDQIRNSPFFSLGCCKEEKKLGEACCCDELLTEYKDIRKKDDIKLIDKIKTTDPLFASCKKVKKYRAQIETIENESSESKEEEEDFDF